MADDPECADFSCIRDMGTDACACVIITDPDDSQRLRCVFRKFAQIDELRRLFASHEFYRDIQTLGKDLVDLRLYGQNLLGGRLCRKDVVTFGLLLLHMSVSGARTSEHLHHRGIQHVFAGMRWLVLEFIMLIQNRCFHD